MLADPAAFLVPTERSRRLKAQLVVILTVFALGFALIPLAAITVYIVSQGIGVIGLDFFTQDPPGDLSAAGGGSAMRSWERSR